MNDKMQRKATDYIIGHDDNDVFICRPLKNGKISKDVNKIEPLEMTSIVAWWIEKELSRVKDSEGVAIINPNGEQYIIYRSTSIDKSKAYEDAQKLIEMSKTNEV